MRTSAGVRDPICQHDAEEAWEQRESREDKVLKTEKLVLSAINNVGAFLTLGGMILAIIFGVGSNALRNLGIEPEFSAIYTLEVFATGVGVTLLCVTACVAIIGLLCIPFKLYGVARSRYIDKGRLL